MTDRPTRQAIYAALNTNYLKIGPKKVRSLLNRYRSIEDVWEKATDQEIVNLRSRINIKKNYQSILDQGIKIITWDDDDYPAILKELPDPPYLIYLRGKLKKNFWGVGVVGSRKWTDYGKVVTEELVKSLVEFKVPVISGLALGIDAIAHHSCLKYGGETVAVLGCGPDRVYPVSHTALASEIVNQGGAIISEYPIGTPALPHHFPVRNRIIAGLAKGVLVIEASLKSGSLLTAQAALEYNREVLAVPHPIFSPTGQGPNNLLKMGATVVTNASDILAALSIVSDRSAILPSRLPPTADTATEAVIINCLSRGPLHIDGVVERSQVSINELNATMTLMEMKGKVINLGGNIYQLKG